MRILQIGAKNYPPAHGGTERLVANLVDGRLEHQSYIFVEWNTECNNPRVQRLPKNLYKKWKFIREFIEKHRVDIVHLHKTNNTILGILIKLNGTKCILTVHGCAWRWGEKRWNIAIKIVAILFDFLATLFLDRVVLVGDHDWLSFRRFLPHNKLQLIRNGVTVISMCPKATVKNKGWVYVGRLSPEKNIIKLLDAVDVLPEKLALYGPISPSNNTFEKILREKLKHANAQWMGPLPSENVREALSNYEVFINPSTTEGLPFTVLEAAAEGLHLVLSDIRPHRLLRFPSCHYVNPKRIDLTTSLQDSNNYDGQANRRHVSEEYNVETMLNAYYSLYQEVLTNKHSEKMKPYHEELVEQTGR